MQHVDPAAIIARLKGEGGALVREMDCGFPEVRTAIANNRFYANADNLNDIGLILRPRDWLTHIDEMMILIRTLYQQGGIDNKEIVEGQLAKQIAEMIRYRDGFWKLYSAMFDLSLVDLRDPENMILAKELIATTLASVQSVRKGD